MLHGGLRGRGCAVCCCAGLRGIGCVRSRCMYSLIGDVVVAVREDAPAGEDDDAAQS